MAGNDKYTPFTQFELSVDLNEGVGGAKAQTYLNQYIQAIKNLTDESRAFASEIKRAKDKLTQTVYVEQSMQGAAQKAFSNVRQRQTIMQDEDFIIPTSFSQTAPEIEQSRFTRKINDKYRRADVASYVARHGGVMEKNPIKEGYYDIIAPRAVIGETPEGDPKYLDTEIKRKIRRINDAKRRREEQEAQEKIIAEQTKAEESISLGEGYGGSSGSGGSGGGRKIGLGTGLSNRSILNSVKTGVGTMLVIKGVMEAVKLLAKIYQLVSQFTKQSLSDSVKAEGLGINAHEVREYRIFEKSKAIQEGSFVNALSKINTTFGRLQSLARSDAALENVAPFLQDKIVSLVERAKGNQTSTEVMNTVFDEVIKQVIAGKDVLGNKTTKENALVSHIEALKASGVFSDFAPILERFFYEYNNPNTTAGERGRMRAGGLSGWIASNSSITNASGISSQDITFAADIQALSDEIGALVGVLKEGIAVHFSSIVEGALVWIERFLRNFMDPRAARDKVNSVKTNLLEQKRDTFRELSDVESLDVLKPEMASAISNTISDEDIREVFSGDYVQTAAEEYGRGELQKYEYLMATLNKEGQSMLNQLAYYERLKTNLRKNISAIDKQLSSNNPKDISANKNTAIADSQSEIVFDTERMIKAIEDDSYLGELNHRMLHRGGYFNTVDLSPESIARQGVMEKQGDLKALSEENKFAVSGNAMDLGLASASLAMARQFAMLQYGKFLNENESGFSGNHTLKYGVANGVVYLDILDARTGKPITERMAMETMFNNNLNDRASATVTVDPNSHVFAGKMGVKGQ